MRNVMDLVNDMVQAVNPSDKSVSVESHSF